MRDYTARFIQIPMRDGIELGAVLYLPAGAGRVPAVMEMTPYLADNAHSIGVEFAREGLAFVAVDCRGRGGSGDAGDCRGCRSPSQRCAAHRRAAGP